MKFRKKPVVIDAVRWDGKNLNPFVGFISPAYTRDGGLRLHGNLLHIDTLEGTMTANPGDWIIKGVKGELYPCKPDIFEATYDAVEPVQP